MTLIYVMVATYILALILFIILSKSNISYKVFDVVMWIILSILIIEILLFIIFVALGK